jgi:hypothetical protein
MAAPCAPSLPPRERAARGIAGYSARGSCGGLAYAAQAVFELEAAEGRGAAAGLHAGLAKVVPALATQVQRAAHALSTYAFVGGASSAEQRAVALAKAARLRQDILAATTALATVFAGSLAHAVAYAEVCEMVKTILATPDGDTHPADSMHEIVGVY